MGASIWGSRAFPSSQRLPDLELTSLGGGTEQLAGAARSARYGGLRYLFVNQGNDGAAVRRYLEANGLSAVAGSVYLDRANSAYDALAASSLPASYFFREDGSLHEARGVSARPELLIHTLEPLLEQP